MKIICKIIKVIYYSAIWIIILLGAFVLISYIFGIRFYSVKTGSMEPEIMTGSICFVDSKTKFEEIQQGDIIAFIVNDNMLVTHRAVYIEENEIITKGDANNSEDSSPVTKETYIGKTIYWIPYIGKLLLYIQINVSKMICVFLILLFMITEIIIGIIQKKAQAEKKSSDK